VSDTCPRNRKVACAALLLLLAAEALLQGCLTPKHPILNKSEESLLEAKGDAELGKAVRKGGRDTLGVIVVFRRDVFLGQSSMLDRSSIPVLSEFGKTAILLVRPAEILPLLADPSVAKAAWFGPQGNLARLEPSIEYDLLGRFGKGAEGTSATLLARFRSVPERRDEQAMEAAGFRILSRGGQNLVISGPWSGIPKVLNHDWLVYLEKGTSP
jgi:hypothetical protein